MFEPLLLPVVNRLLATNSWSAEKLAPHAGKILAFDCPPFVARFRLLPDGRLEAADSASAADTTITVTPPLLLRLAARDENAWKETVVAGDAGLAAALDYVWRNLVWDFEEDLSRVFGDIAAHRMAEGVRALDRWRRNATLDVGRAFAEYAIYEKPVVASAEGMQDFVRDVDAVRNDVDRLEQRIALLARTGHADS